MELNPLLDILNTEMLCFVVKKKGSEYMQDQFPAFNDQNGNICLVQEPYCLVDVWKHFKYWLSSFNFFINLLNLRPKGQPSNFTVQVSASNKFNWMFLMKIILFAFIFRSSIFETSFTYSFFCDF